MKQDMSIPSEYEQEYRQIHWSLENSQWEQANRLTLKILDKLGLKENKIPGQELRVLDEWWKNYSNGHFGFSAQIQILEKIWKQQLYKQQLKNQTKYQDGINVAPVNELVVKSSLQFVETVGWYDRGNYSYLCWKDLKFNLEDAPVGHLPSYLIRLDSELDYKPTKTREEFYYSILKKIEKSYPYYYLYNYTGPLSIEN